MVPRPSHFLAARHWPGLPGAVGETRQRVGDTGYCGDVVIHPKGTA